MGSSEGQREGEIKSSPGLGARDAGGTGLVQEGRLGWESRAGFEMPPR